MRGDTSVVLCTASVYNCSSIIEATQPLALGNTIVDRKHEIRNHQLV